MKKFIILIFSLLFTSCAYATSTNLTPGHLVYTSATNCGPNANAACASDSPVTTNGTTASIGGSVICTVASGCGNAATATALAITPTKCNAGYFPLGIDVSGNAQNCTLVSSGAGSVTSIATTSPITGGTITSTGTIGIQVANTSQAGYLTSADWNTFNGKQVNLSVAKGSYVDGDICTYSASGTLLNCNTSPAGAGTVTSITASSPLTGGTITGSGSIGIPASNGSTNGYLASGDWTTFNNKISANQTITLSGDVSGSGTTAITTAIGSSKVTNTMLAGNIAANKLIGTDISTLGTITSGTWNGTVIGVAYGGTGLSTAPANSLMLGNGTTYNSKTLSDCQDSVGNHLNFNATTGAFSCGSTGPSGAVTSVGLSSTAKTLIVTNTPVTSAGTINADINWTDFNLLSSIGSGGVNWTDVNLHALMNMGGINWNDAKNLNQGVNWYQVDLVAKTLTTTGSGVGNIKMYDSSGVNYVDISAPATIAASKTWVWPGTDGSANQVIKTDGGGNLSFASPLYLTSVNVGIGSSNPGTALDVTGTTRSTAFSLGGSTITSWPSGSPASPSGSIQYNNSSAFGGTANFFTDGTNVGIGTSTAYENYEGGYQLIALSNQEFQANLISTNSTYGGGISIGQDTGSAVVSGARIGKIEFSGPVDSTGINNGYSAAGMASYAQSNWSSSNTNADLLLQTTPPTSLTRTTALWIDGGGNIGIGTLQPTGGALQIGTDTASVTNATILCNCSTSGGVTIGKCTGTITGDSCTSCSCISK